MPLSVQNSAVKWVFELAVMSRSGVVKVAYPNSFRHFSLPSMHEAVDEAVLSNNFFQNSSASPRKLLIKLFSNKQLYL